MGDVGMGGVEAAIGRVDVIAALGHGQRHDADRRVGHLADQRGVALLDRDIADHRACYLRRLARRVQFDQRRQAILRQHLLALNRIGGAHARADDRPVEV